MKKLKIAIALFLALSFVVSLFAVLPNAAAQVVKMPDIVTGSFASVNPHLIGTGQDLTVNLWVYPSQSGPQGGWG